MGRDGAEGAAAKTSTMEAYGESYHLVGRDAFALVFRMWQMRIGQVAPCFPGVSWGYANVEAE